MGKHRELAKELYSSRIWRTVVFAGAMLGTPGVAAADKAAPTPAPQPANPPAKPTPPAAGAPAQPKAAEAAVVAVPPKPDAITLKAQAIATANTERNALIEKLNSVEPKELDALNKQINVKDAQIKKLVTELVNLRKPRPRTPPESRPVGRGFVLA